MKNAKKIQSLIITAFLFADAIIMQNHAKSNGCRYLNKYQTVTLAVACMQKH
jgi:hypothetical protein